MPHDIWDTSSVDADDVAWFGMIIAMFIYFVISTIWVLG